MSHPTVARVSYYKTLSFEDLETLVDFNAGLPEVLREPPWKVPSNQPEADTINQILGEIRNTSHTHTLHTFFSDHSFKVQCSVISSADNPSDPKSIMNYGLTKRILDSNCLNLSILLRHYLNTLRLDATVICGMLINPSNPKMLSITHVFLDIGNTTIDNQYTMISSADDHLTNRTNFFKQFKGIRQLSNYSKTPPSKFKAASWLNEEFKKDGDDRQFGQDLLELESLNEHEQNKTVAFSLATAAIEPGLLIYDKLMTGFIKKTFSVDVPSLVEKMAGVCWSCEMEAAELKTCAGCGVARYCGKTCITKDWEVVHKQLHIMAKKIGKNRLGKDFQLKSLNPI